MNILYSFLKYNVRGLDLREAVELAIFYGVGKNSLLVWMVMNGEVTKGVD
jgi:hypothetical protein